jgi:hypothetical protein
MSQLDINTLAARSGNVIHLSSHVSGSSSSTGSFGRVETDNLTVGGSQGSDGQVLTSTGGGVGWEDAAGGVDGITSTASATAITIDSSENVKFHKRVGIGTTPDLTWDNLSSSLRIGDFGALWNYFQIAARQELHLSENVYSETMGAYFYIANGKASDYQQEGGVHTFKVAGSGTADNAISWTTAMTIENSGDTKFYGDVLPSSHNSKDLGSNGVRWANLYVADAHYSNVGTGGNDVDGTEGSWTIQEGEEDLFLLNRKNGKKFKFKLQEIE